MPISFAITLDDADLEAGVAQARAAYNASADTPIATDALYAQKIATDTFEAFRGSARRALAAKVEQLSDEDIAVVAADVDAKIVLKPRESAPLEEVIKR